MLQLIRLEAHRQRLPERDVLRQAAGMRQRVSAPRYPCLVEHVSGHEPFNALSTESRGQRSESRLHWVCCIDRRGIGRLLHEPRLRGKCRDDRRGAWLLFCGTGTGSMYPVQIIGGDNTGLSAFCKTIGLCK